MDAQIVGERIAKLRKSKNMTQKQLADEISVTYKAISKWETGAGLPDIAILPALASVLCVSVDEILSGSTNVKSKENNHSNLFYRINSVLHYVRKPAVVIMSSLVVIIAMVIVINNIKTDEFTDIKTDGDIAKYIKIQLLQSFNIDEAFVVVRTGPTSPFRIHANEKETMVTVFLVNTDTYLLSDIDLHAVGNLIRDSLPNIKDENITIKDNNFNYYTINS